MFDGLMAATAWRASNERKLKTETSLFFADYQDRENKVLNISVESLLDLYLLVY